MTASLSQYAAAEFGAPDRECDLVMKGGVTSGLVYPYAILELARVYRFRAIGGTSAGGIAAAFAAAAEYARTVRQDPDAFIRLQRRCDELPERLASLFQPTPRYAGLMAFLLRAQAGGGIGSILWALLRAFWGTAVLGVALGAVVMVLLDAGWAGAVLGAISGPLVAFAIRLSRLIGGLSQQGFGMCPGLQQPGSDQPALADWLHASLQDIAFGDADHPKPLTFGDLSGPGAGDTPIHLRMMTTNLSMRRPHALPKLGIPAGLKLEEWAAYFPSPVIAHLAAVTEPLRRAAHLRAFPKDEDLPVLVAVRMSLSFPILFSAVPMFIRDVESAVLSRRTGGDGRVHLRRLWFTDGGLSSNFPIHLFDAVLPTRPTFALSLDDLPPGARPDGERVTIPKSAGEAFGLPVHEVTSLGGFVSSLLGSAKDWRDNLLAGMPGQRERIARVLLSKREGGLNLTMAPEISRALMAYGQEVGRRFAQGALDFDEHRWRRSLVAYEQLEGAVRGVAQVWDPAGFGAFLKAYGPKAKSYGEVTKTDRRNIHARLAAFAALAAEFSPPLRNPHRKLPRPSARMRIGPDV